MIQGFQDQGSEDVYNGVDSRAARRACPQSIWRIARRKLDQLNAAPRLEVLRAPPGNQLEALKGDRKGLKPTMTRLPTNRPPTHPGEMLLEEFIQPHGLSLAETARRLRISYPRLHEIVRGKRGVTIDTALRLQALFGMDADFWLNLQRDWDLWHALRSPLAQELKEIPTLAHV